MNRVTRQLVKKTFVLSLVLGSGLLLTGCGTKKTATNTPTSSRPTALNEDVTLTIWRTFDDEATLTPIINDYISNHPKVHIKYVKKDVTDYETQSINALAAGTGPDIWSIPNTFITRHAGKLVPMPENFFVGKGETRNNNDYVNDNWIPVVGKDNIIDKKVYGLPLYTDSLALYVNSDLWDKGRQTYRQANSSNPNFDDSLFRKGPATWNDLLDELPFLTKKDNKGNIIQSGLAIGTSNNVPFAADILSLLMMQNGATMVDKAQNAARFNTFQNDSKGAPVYNGTNALDFYTSFARPDKSNYTWNNSMPDAFQAFITGKSAMMIGYQFLTGMLAQQAPTLMGQIYPVPQVKGNKPVNFASYWTETVTNNSRHPDVAWDFLAYATTHPNSYLSATKRTTAGKSSSPYDPSDTFNYQASTSDSWFKGKYPDKIDGVFSEMIDNVVTKKQPPQQTIDNAATAVTGWLQKE